METTLTTSPEKAAAFIQRGQLAAFPTETVYGLGADAFQADAVERIFDAKGRPADNPLIVHLHRRASVREVASTVPAAAKELLEHFAPGPLTLILPKEPSVPSVVTAGLATVGVRIPAHPTAQTFLAACHTPVAAPSANRSGRPSPTTWTAVQADLGGRIACILKGGRTDAGVESTVVDCTTTPPTVLRPGAVAVETLREVVGDVAFGTETSETKTPRSPGTKHRHYAPSAQVHLLEEPATAEPTGTVGYIGLEPPPDPEQFRLICRVENAEQYARELFHFFRRCDDAGCEAIFAQTMPDEGLGRALNDRLRRAAAR